MPSPMPTTTTSTVDVVPVAVVSLPRIGGGGVKCAFQGKDRLFFNYYLLKYDILINDNMLSQLSGRSVQQYASTQTRAHGRDFGS